VDATSHQVTVSLRTSAHTGVAIRSPKYSDFDERKRKTASFKDADCHVAALLAMTVVADSCQHLSNSSININLKKGRKKAAIG